MIGALLHDAVEDQGGAATREEIRRKFGDSVVAIVDGTSDMDLTPKHPGMNARRRWWRTSVKRRNP